MIDKYHLKHTNILMIQLKNHQNIIHQLYKFYQIFLM